MLHQHLSAYAAALLRRSSTALPRLSADLAAVSCIEQVAGPAASGRCLHTATTSGPLRQLVAQNTSGVTAGLCWTPVSSLLLASGRQIHTSAASLARDYYDVLGVSKTATDGEIKKSYYQLAKKFHPDANPGNAEAQKKFQEVSQAYDTLKDPQQRAIYNQVGPEGMAGMGQGGPQGGPQGNPFGSGFQGFSWSTQQGFNPGGANINDLFEEFFSGGEASPFGRQGARGADVSARISLSFMEAMQGGPKTLNLSARGGAPREVSINIPPGAAHGEMFQVEGEGLPSQRRGGRPGNLMLQVEVRSHPTFRREGDHLFQELNLDFVDAILGTDVRVPLLSGTTVIAVRPGTQAGTQVRIAKQGVPRGPRSPGGDMFVIVSVAIPRTVSERQRQLLQDFVEEDKLRRAA